MTAPGGLAYENYGTGEWLMRIGPAEGAPILFVPPLFEEMNRTRAFIAGVMRRLAERGHGCLLPDLPGTGESLRALETVGWEDWRSALAALPAPRAVVSVRGGALLDDAVEASRYYRFAPVEGASLARDMARSGLAGGGGTAGYRTSEALMDALAAAVPAPIAPLRTVRLASDPREADRKLEGPALWRRSEPSGSPELAAALAEDISDWVTQCAVS